MPVENGSMGYFTYPKNPWGVWSTKNNPQIQMINSIEGTWEMHILNPPAKRHVSLSRPGPWNKSLNFIFPTKYGIPKSLKPVSHWPFVRCVLKMTLAYGAMGKMFLRRPGPTHEIIHRWRCMLLFQWNVLPKKISLWTIVTAWFFFWKNLQIVLDF